MLISRRFQIILTTTAALAAALVLAAPSGAATRVGQSCTTGLSSGPPLSFQSTIASGTSYTAPTSGVITRWGSKQNYAVFPPVYARLALASGGVGSIKVDSFGSIGLMRNGVDEVFAERIPIAAGQSIGIWAFPAAPLCSGLDPANSFAYYSGDPTLIAPGLTFAPTSGTGVLINVWADVEADVDGDGYGDETQDACPQSAAYQIACPVLAISQQLSANSKQISILATASENASLTATAKVKIGRKTVTIKGKATTFTAGKLKSIKLKLPASVKKSLKSGKKLTASVTLTGNGIANTATATGKVKLKK